MDLYRIIDTLIAERNRIDRLIQSLDSNARTDKDRARIKKVARPPGKRPGRKSMDVRARRDVSERMKRYWSQRRGGEAVAAATNVEDMPVPQVHGVSSGNQEAS